MHNLTLPKSGREAIGREILKERIREEILAREMVERRILEEEVRREIEMERIMEIRRLQMERRSEFAGTSGMLVHGDRQTQTFMPSWMEAGIAASLSRGIVKDGAELAFRERSSPHLLHKKTMTAMAQSALRPESEKHSPSKETNKTTNCKLSGAKRKVQDEFMVPTEKLWGCALCEVSTSSEEALKEHLQGKKHKAKEALLSSNKKTAPSQSKQNATPPSGGSSGSGGATKKKLPEGKKQLKFWCCLCRVKCNSSVMMEYHLAGKKHRNVMELKKGNSSFKTEAVKTVTNEKLGDTARAGIVKEESETGGINQ